MGWDPQKGSDVKDAMILTLYLCLLYTLSYEEYNSFITSALSNKHLLHNFNRGTQKVVLLHSYCKTYHVTEINSHPQILCV